MDLKSNKRKCLLDLTQEAPSNKITRQTLSQESVSTDLKISNNLVLDKITAVWKTTSSSAKNLLSYEGQDIKAKIKEDEEKYVQISKMVQSCQQDLENLENNVSEFKIAFEKIIAQNQILKEKYADALELSESFTQFVNYINNTLSRCTDHTQIIKKMYGDVLKKLEEDENLMQKSIDELNQAVISKKELKVNLEQIKLELEILKIENKRIRNNILQKQEEINKIMNKLKINGEIIEQMEILKTELKSLIEELENSLIQEEKKMREQMSLTEESKIKKINERQENDLSSVHEELNDTKSLMNSIQEHKEKILKKDQQKKKFVDDLERNLNQYSLRVEHMKIELNKVTVALRQSDKAKISLEKKINEIYHDCSIKLNEFELITREKSNSNDELKILNSEFKKKEQERKRFSNKLGTRKIQLEKAIQLSDKVEREIQNYQETKESKVGEIQKQMESVKESIKNISNENKEIRANKRKFEREYKKEFKTQEDQYRECLTTLKNLSSLNEKSEKKLVASKNVLRSLETDNKKSKNEYEKWQKSTGNELKNTERSLNVKNNSEKQLKEEISKLEAYLKDLDKKRQQLKTNSIKIAALKKSQSNIENKTQSNIKYENENLLKSPITYQSKNQPAKSSKIRVIENKILEKKVKSILKPQTNLKSPKSPGRKLQFQEPLSRNSKKTLDYFSGLSAEEEYEKLSQTMTNSPRLQFSASQGSYSSSASPATSTHKKFFKSRGAS